MKTASTCSILAFAGATILVSAGASAAPAAEPHCKTKVVNPAGAAGIMFDEDCHTAYVLPPVTGKASVSAVAPNTNLNFCPAVNQAGVVASKTIASAGVVADKIAAMIKGFDPLNKDLQDLQDKLAVASADKDAAAATLANDQIEQQEHISQIGVANSAYQTCVALNSPAQCEEALRDLNAEKAEYRTFIVNKLGPDQQKQIATQAAFDALSFSYTRKTKNLADATAPLFDLQAKLAELSNSVEQAYVHYAPLEGFTAQLTYSIPWDTLLTSYQAANPTLDFVRLPITEAKFSATAMINNVATSLPAILAYAIPGMPKQGAIPAPPAGGFLRLGFGKGGDVGPAYMPFGSSLSAQIVTSLTGSCDFYPNGYSGGVVGNINELTAHVTANLNYLYEIKARRGYTASYNMSSWISRVEKVKKKGGFFTSSTIHSVMEDGNSSDWFSIKFDQQASGFAYSDQEKVNLTKEVKGQLMERALRLIAMQNGSMSKGPPSTPPLAPTGIGTAAGYLMGGCGFWSWCTVAGWVLGTLDSIFGSSTAVSDFKKSNSAWVTDTVKDTAILLRPGSLTFVKP